MHTKQIQLLYAQTEINNMKWKYKKGHPLYFLNIRGVVVF